MPAQFVQPPSASLPGLGVETGGAVWLGRTVRETLAAEAEQAGLQLAGPGVDVISLSGPAVATAEAFRAFVQASDGVEGDVVGRLVAPYDRWCREPGLGGAVDLVRCRGGGPIDAERLAAATRIRVPVDGQGFDLPLLDRIGGRNERVDLSMALVLPLGSWAALLWANLFGIGPRLIQELPGSATRRPFRLAWAALRAGSTKPDRVGLHLNRVGKDVQIHRNATVEGCILGDGVVVDAGAVVRHSVLGVGARVEAQGLCLGSVVGPRAVVQRRGFVSYGVLDAGAVCGGTLQLAYLGPEAQLKVEALLLDQVLDGAVRLAVGGELVEAPFGVLGVGLGARSMVGGRVTVAAGRVVAAGTTVVAGDGSLLLRPATPSEGGRYRVVQGELEPC